MLADIERPEHRRLCGPLTLPVVDGIDQHRDAQHVREQNEFLPDRRAFLARACQEVDRHFPFAESEIGPANIVVQ